jgi:hypothetical protein
MSEDNSQLSAAMNDSDSAPFGLPPSVAPVSPSNIDEHLQYLDQINGSRPQALPSAAASTSASRFVSSANRNSSNSGIANWIAGMAGVDPTNPTQPAPQPVDRLRGLVSNEPTPEWPFPPPIFNSRQR